MMRPIPARLRTAIRLFTLLFTTGGILLAALSIFASQLGLDNDPGWGKGRIALAAAGVLLLISAACLVLRARLAYLARAVASSRISAGWYRLGQSVRASRLSLAVPDGFRRLAGLRPLPRSSRACGLLAAGISLLVYVWYLTSGTWTTWTPYSQYFDRQANAFRAGQVALLEEPSPQLKALANPYDWRARENIGHLWDVSFYRNRFFLYWGPAPAMLAALVKAIAPVTVEDQTLLLFFCGGLVFMLGLLLAMIHDRLYSDLPTWTVFGLTLLGGLALPILWLVNRPSVYETAIAGGQFFMVSGLYCALRACLRDEPPSPGWLAAAGLAWGAALACRLSLVLAVALFCAVIAWYILRQTGGQAALLRVVVLGLPLILWATGLAWYNFARFGSILETGHRYQLTGPALPTDYHFVTSPTYIVPSLYSYMVRPLQFSATEFPFIFAPFIKESMWPFFIQPPRYYYYPEPLAGIFAVLPAAWLGLLPLLGLLNMGWRWLNDQPVSLRPIFSTSGSGLVWALTIGGSACLLAPLLVFITTSMRYLADITPLVVLLAALGLWWGLHASRDNAMRRRGLTLAATLLILGSIVISLLVNFGNGDRRFATNNPALYASIADFFNRNP